MHIFHTLPWVMEKKGGRHGGWGGVLDHFSKHLSRKDLGQIGILRGISTLGGGDFFQL